MSSSNINNLPPELLRIIFVCFSQKYDYKYSKIPVVAPLSQVCVRWRALALATQELWTSVLPRESFQWTKACLERCPTSSFNFILWWSFPGSDEYRSATELVLPHFRRAETVDIHLMPNSEEGHEDICNLLKKICEYSMASASTVKLSLANPDGEWEPTTLPWNLYSRVDPSRLTKINYCDCIVPAATPWQILGSNIREVILSNSTVWDDTDSMVAFFQALPVLEDFELEFYREQTPLYHSFSKSRHTRCIRLDRLRSLDLRHYWLDNLIIFMCVCMPSDTWLRLLSLEYWDYIDELPRDEVLDYFAMGKEALLQHFAPAIAQGSSYPAITIDMYGDEPREGRFTIEVASWKTGLWYSQAKTPSTPPLLPTDICFDLPRTSKRDIRRAAAAMFTTLPIFIRATKISFNRDLWDLYPEAYEAYTAVTTLRVFGETNAEAVRSILCTRGALFVPTMKRLHLELVNNVDLIMGVLDALSSAHAATHCFERLELYRCGAVEKETLRSRIGKRLGAQHITVVRVSR